MYGTQDASRTVHRSATALTPLRAKDMICAGTRQPAGRAATFVLIGCLAATPGAAQSAAGELDLTAQAEQDFPTAQDIWRHLPNRDTQSEGPEPDNALPDVQPPLPGDEVSLPQSMLSDARIVIHHSVSAGPERSQDLARRLKGAGAGEVEIRGVGFPIEQYSIRYFHAEDRTVSNTVAGVMDPVSTGDVDDFTHFRPRPRGGTVEIWVP